MSDETEQASPEEAEAMMEAMQNLPGPGQYTAMDKYRDFRQVFMATEQGKRVLYEILAWGHMFRPSAMMNIEGPIDPYMTHYREGERNVALKLLSTINNEPVAPPTEANKQRGES